MKAKFFGAWLLAAMCCLAGCSGTSEVSGDEPQPTPGPGTDPVGEGTVVLKVDRNYIVSDGADLVTFNVLFAPKSGGDAIDITDTAEIFVNGSETLTSPTFTTTESGDYTFYAIYDINMSNEVKVSAYAALPEAPADAEPANNSFKHRIMLVQHTGTGCVNCPRMMTSLKALAEDENYAGRYTHVASHSYISEPEDPCRSKAADNLSRIYCSGYYPELTFNLTSEATGTALSEIQGKVDALQQESAPAGIAAQAILVGNDLLVSVNVKVAEPGDYALGVWVLEDEVYGAQSGATEPWQNTHENALRAMVTNANSMTDFSGERLFTLRDQTTATAFFRVVAEQNWVAEHCKFLLFVTAPNAEGNYDIVNSVVCPLNSTVEFDYN